MTHTSPGPTSALVDIVLLQVQQRARGSLACPDRNEACRVIGRGPLEVIVCHKDGMRAVGHDIMSHADVLPSSLLRCGANGLRMHITLGELDDKTCKELVTDPAWAAHAHQPL